MTPGFQPGIESGRFRMLCSWESEDGAGFPAWWRVWQIRDALQVRHRCMEPVSGRFRMLFSGKIRG